MNSESKYEALNEKIDKIQEAISQDKQNKNLHSELEKAQSELRDLMEEIKKSKKSK